MVFAMDAVVLFRALISARFGMLLIGWRYFSSIKEADMKNALRGMKTCVLLLVASLAFAPLQVLACGKERWSVETVTDKDAATYSWPDGCCA